MQTVVKTSNNEVTPWTENVSPPCTVALCYIVNFVVTLDVTTALKPLALFTTKYPRKKVHGHYYNIQLT